MLVVTCWTLAGCAANFNAQTNQQYQAGEGISDRSGAVYVLNALVVTDGAGNGTLVGTLINQSGSPDALQSVSAVDSQNTGIQITTLKKPIALASQAAVKLETDAAVRLKGSGVKAGDFITVTLLFQNAAPVKIGIPVVPGGPGTIYTGIPLGPA